jgi:hypothetical protein
MSRRFVVLAGLVALVLAGLQLLGGGLDWLGSSDFWFTGPVELLLGACWLLAGIALLRGIRGIWGRLVALVAVTLAISMLEAALKFRAGDIDKSQVLSVGLEIMFAVALAVPGVRGALQRTSPIPASPTAK